jgi:hypothetical protein
LDIQVCESNGEYILAQFINQSEDFLSCSWGDEGGAYHDSGWNESWPDGWSDSHGK